MTRRMQLPATMAESPDMTLRSGNATTALADETRKNESSPSPETKERYTISAARTGADGGLVGGDWGAGDRGMGGGGEGGAGGGEGGCLGKGGGGGGGSGLRLQVASGTRVPSSPARRQPSVSL